jgi:hypothetical protein
MTVEDELREALAAEAEQVSPAPDAWRRVVESAAAGERRRRRRLWLGSGAATGLAAVVALVAVVAVRDDGAKVRTLDPAVNPTTSVPVPSTVPDRTVSPPPFIGYQNDGRIIEVTSWLPERSERVLATAKFSPEVHPRLGQVAASPDGKTVYYDATDGVWQVSRAVGGPPTRIGAGRLPSASPNGSTLAYARGGVGDSLVLRDLATGKERVLAAKKRPASTFRTLSWSEDSTTLFVFWEWKDTEGYIEVDVRTATSLDDARNIEQPATSGEPNDGFSFRAAFGGRTVAVHRCCLVEAPVGISMEWDETWQRLTILSPEGEWLGDAVDLRERAVSALTVSKFGTLDYAMYVVEDRELWGWDGVNPPTLLAGGMLSGVIAHDEF